MGVTVAAPKGAHFEFEAVRTAGGTKDLGEVPILVWDNLDDLIAHLGAEGVLNMSDGTSLRVSYQSIARRFKGVNKEGKVKTDDEVAQAQIDFRPGKRQGGASTPQSRAKRAASAAAEKVDGDAVAALLEQIASGKLTQADIEALTGVQSSAA